MTDTDSTANTIIQRRFDVTTDITGDWFRSYVRELERYAKDEENADCEVRLGPDFENLVMFRNRKTWSDYVLANWTEVAETSIWPRAGVLRRAFCNHRRQHVVLRLDAGAPDIERTFELLCQTLTLRPSPKLPYKYRRSSLEFEIGNWRPDCFALGIERIAALLGADPDVPEAYAKSFEGDIEKLTPFFDLKTFCDTIGKRASRFGEVVIRMRGRSIAVGVGVTSDHKKLRVRTSLPPDEVDKLIAVWPEELKLKPVKATDTGAAVGGTVPAPSENPWLKYGLTIILAIVTAASTAGVVSLKKAVWPDYKIVITSPHVENGIAGWTGDHVPIDWYLLPDQASFRAAKKDVVATVRVNGPSGSQLAIEAKPPLSIPLPPGSYIVLVDATGATPATFQVVIEKLPSKADQRGSSSTY